MIDLLKKLLWIAAGLASGVILTKTFLGDKSGLGTGGAADRVQERFSEEWDPAQMGPFAYRFKARESARFQLRGNIAAVGFDPEGGDNSNFTLESTVSVAVRDVLGRGAADLVAQHEAARLTGRLRGEQVQLEKAGDGIRYSRGGQLLLDTTRGGDLSQWPQLAMLSEPITLEVAPSGRIRKAEGPEGSNSLLSPVKIMSLMTFPDSRLEVGDRWETEFTLQAPDAADPMTARVENRLVGFQQVTGRKCAVIQQVFANSTKGGRLGEAAKVFNLTGQNNVYFDVDRSEFVYSEIQLHFAFNMGKAMKSVVDGVGAYVRLLEQVASDDGPAAQEPERDQDGPSCDFGVTVSAVLRRVS